MVSTAGGATTYTFAGSDMNELVHQDAPGSVAYDYVYSRPTPQGVPTLDSVTKNGSTTTIINDPVTGQPQSLTTSTGQNNYFATNGQGSVVALVVGTAGGSVTGTWAYDPYGTITATTGSSGAFFANPYYHAGGLEDPTTGWNRHGVRYNDNTTGRWTTQDPITRLTNPAQANPYSYATNNPVNYTDPTGRCSALDAALGVGGIAILGGAFEGAEAGSALAIGVALEFSPGAAIIGAVAGISAIGLLTYCALD